MSTIKKSIFVEGAIAPENIAQSIAKHQSKINIGAHSIFLGQVRADNLNGNVVQSIEYSAYTEMADNKMLEIREKAFDQFDLICAHVYHSLGKVSAGEICLFIFTSSAHRNAAQDACAFFLENIKRELPIFGKEIFENSTHQWKVNQ